jgi:2TM domain
MSDLINEPDLAYNEAYRSASKRVNLLKSWYIHASIFCCVIGFFWLQYLFGGTFGDWAGYTHTPRMPFGVTLGWGLGLTIHGFVVWGKVAMFGQNWKQAQMKKLFEKQGLVYRENQDEASL